MANWPEKTDSCVGTCTKYGAPDVRRFARLYNNQNVNTGSLACSTVCINEDNTFEFQSDSSGNTALYLQEPNAGCHNIRIKTTILAANSVATIPALGTTDTFTFNTATATLTNKTLDLNSNTLLNTGAAKGDQLIYNLVCTKYESQAVRETFKIDFGSETTAIATGDGQKEFQMPYNFTITEIYATVKTASSSGIPSIQIQQNNLDILSTALTIDANEKTSRTATTPVVIADTSLDINGIIEFDIDVIGTGTEGLVIYLIGYQRF
jgi:hypothetical protein|tara:strand:- start:4019 stop:4813 length:795 start_codon:yes stop_codon:yes gene_type:complete